MRISFNSKQKDIDWMSGLIFDCDLYFVNFDVSKYL